MSSSHWGLERYGFRGLGKRRIGRRTCGVARSVSVDEATAIVRTASHSPSGGAPRRRA